MSRVLRAQVLVSIALVAAISGSAANGSEARILGTVVDTEGRPIDGVLVSIEAVRVQIDKTGFTDKKGRFSITLTDASREYEIDLSKTGYLALRESLQPRVGGLLRQTWVLNPGPDEEAEASASLVEAQALAQAVSLFNDGADAYRRGEIDIALERFQDSATLDPELTAPLAGMARIYVAQGNFDDALLRVEALLALDPTDLVGLRIRFDALAALGRAEEADVALDHLVTADPTPGTARRVFNRGVEAVRTNDLKGAALRFEKALELDETLTPALLALSQIYLSLHEPDRAIGYAEQVVRRDAENTDALSVIYQAHLTLGDELSAQAAFDSLQSIDPVAISKAFYKEGVAQFNAGDVDLATKTLERVLETDPDHAKTHYSLGLCYLNSGDNAKARQLFERFIELAPEDPDVGSAREMLSFLE